MTGPNAASAAPPLRFHAGTAGAVAPMALFLAGVAWLALSGAPDERGFWPVILAALALGTLLARRRHAYAERVIAGMAQPIVAIMILAWLLAGVLGALLKASGLVSSLAWLAARAGVAGGAFAACAFLVCMVVSTATGTSLGTVILCSPLLYPAGGALGTHPGVLLGAILGGATFGDNVSPVSDTTIASAATQGADLGGVVRSRLRYALPAAALALVGYTALGSAPSSLAAAPAGLSAGDPMALAMVLAPAVVIALLLARRHLLEGLLAGVTTAAVLGLALGRFGAADLLHVEPASFGARGLLVEGMERGVGISIFTILLTGLVAGFEASGVLARLVAGAGRLARSPRGAEAVLVGVVSVATVLTTHSVVALLAVGAFARHTGERFGLSAYRRANLLDLTVCTYPFLLPYCIPTILAASTTVGGEGGMPRLSPLAAGLWNLHSWALLAVTVLAVATGYGRGGDAVAGSPQDPGCP